MSVSGGRPINQEAIDALRRSDMRSFGHKEASDALKDRFGILVNRQGVGRLRRLHGIKWTNANVVSKKVMSMYLSGKEPTYEQLTNEFNVSHSYAMRIIKGNF